jgi:hypothetical protein
VLFRSVAAGRSPGRAGPFQRRARAVPASKMRALSSIGDADREGPTRDGAKPAKKEHGSRSAWEACRAVLVRDGSVSGQSAEPPGAWVRLAGG